jgi:hypothetical protein
MGTQLVSLSQQLLARAYKVPVLFLLGIRWPHAYG